MKTEKKKKLKKKDAVACYVLSELTIIDYKEEAVKIGIVIKEVDEVN